MTKMSNKTYDILKFVALEVLPGLATLYFTLSQIWGWMYAEQVVGSMAAVNTFLGIFLGYSSFKYKRQQNGMVEIEMEDDADD